MYDGRPTSFKEEYCEQIIEHMKKGKSAASFARECDVCEQTMYTWMKKNPYFLECYKKGRSFLKAYYIELASRYLIIEKDGDRLNGTIYTKLMKLQFGRDFFKENYLNIDPADIVDFNGTATQKMEAVSIALKNSIISIENYKILMDGIRIESDVNYNENIAPLLDEDEEEEQEKETKDISITATQDA